MPRRFVLTADDYAMTPAVSHGILRLLDAGRITATGAMTNRPSWRAAARDLAAFEGKADLGIHISLTCGAPLTEADALTRSGALPKLGTLLASVNTGRIPLAVIEAEIEAQLAEFEDVMGRTPDFVDGHQHVHAMPGIRRAFAKVLSQRYPAAKPYVRDAADRFGAIRLRGRQTLKGAVVALLARGFGQGMTARGFALNQGFSGFSAFDPAVDYCADFPSYLIAPGAKPLVMCHPGEVDDELRALDPATESRPKEIAYFLSERFTEACARAGMTPARFADL
ncbi:MAG: hypothetical protein CFE31_06390 [Rhizobiales bacterium PAR1]|nr:MAG: hypothetical protein CFE31_06390 [Rhizobiales bacterium PAR1]